MFDRLKQFFFPAADRTFWTPDELHEIYVAVRTGQTVDEAIRRLRCRTN